MNFYLTLLHNATTNGEDTNIQFDMEQPRIKKADDWLISLERLQLYTGRIPTIIGETIITLEQNKNSQAKITGQFIPWYASMNEFVKQHNLRWGASGKIIIPNLNSQVIKVNKKAAAVLGFLHSLTAEGQ